MLLNTRSLPPLIIILMMISGCTQPPAPVDTPTRQTGEKKYIRGLLSVQVPDKRIPKDIGNENDLYIPGVKVVLSSLASGDETSVITDLSGRFSFPPQASGKYKLCWSKPGYQPECYLNNLEVGSRPVNMGTIRIKPNANFDDSVVLYGSVMMRDEEFPRGLQPVVGINSHARVTAIDSNGNTLHETSVNNQGKYLIPKVSRNEATVTLKAVIEQETITNKLHKEGMQSGAAHKVDMIMRNHIPRVLDIVAILGGKETEIAQPSDQLTLEVKATDADGDKLSYEWQTSTGEGDFSDPTASITSLKLPAERGRYNILVHVRDGHGGYAVGKSTLLVGVKDATFSGRVETAFGGPISGAKVSIGGTAASTSTNAQGYFSLNTALDDRYVLNIHRDGFGPISTIHQRSLENGTWTMQQATVVTVDPTQDITLVDDLKQKEHCYVPVLERVVWKNFPTVQQRRVQDGEGRTIEVERRPFKAPYPKGLVEKRKDRDCGRGAELFIPANSLVDAAGNPPPGLVNVEITTIDLLAPNSMPGDYSVDNGDYMISYGATSVEISAGGVEYNKLKSPATAKIRIPVSDDQLLAGGPLDNEVPRFVYNETSGLWEREGLMKLDASGQFYEADVSHFSTINTDIQKLGQSCVRVNSEGMTVPFELDVVVPIPNAAPVQRTGTVTSNGVYELIINLPNDTDITLMAYNVVNNQVVPQGVYGVNTGQPQNGNPTAPNFSECDTKVLLQPVAIPDPAPDAFLHGLYSFAATRVQENDGTVPNQALKDQIENATISYYNTADPRGLRNNFAKFKAANGLGATPNTQIKSNYGPTDEVRAAYANAIDLGFGRDMHGKRTLASDGQWDIAFYVTNYGDYDTDDTVDHQQAVNQDPDQVVATVAMEWSRIEDGPATDYDYYDPDNTDADPNDPNAPIVFTDGERVVKYYVYDKQGEPVFAADLDGRGVRPIPQLCMVCHGGAYDDGFEVGVPAFNEPADVKLGSVMLPFDIHGYTFSGAVPVDFSKENQQLELFELNDMVKDTEPGAVIEEIIDKLYDPANPAGPDHQLEDFVASGWTANAAHEDMYLNVVKPACRVCHASRPLEATADPTVFRDLRLHEASAFLKTPAQGGIAAATSTRVCTTREMPHALATYNRFWYSYDPIDPLQGTLYQPSRLQAFLDGVVEPSLGGEFGNDCFVTPDADDSVIEEPATLSILQTNVFGGCSGCHGAAGFGGINMDLSSAPASHAAIRNVAAQESSAGLDRIEPNNISQSYLYKKVTDDVSSGECSAVQAGQDCTDAMAPGTNGISAPNREDLEEWINNNALNN